MKILVVEDNPDHMKAAVKVIEAAGYEAVQAINLREGRDGVHGSRVRNPIDGVITDLFIPEGVFRGKECEMSEEADQPRGILIMVLAQNYKLPCIVCTAGFHHGLRYQWVCWLTESLRLPWIVDCESLRDIDPEGESPTKDWQTALDRLVGLIEGKEEI